MLRTLLFSILLSLLPLAAPAQDLPQPLSDTVSDYDDILPGEAQARLAGVLKAARAETGVHIVLVTMSRRERHAGQGRSIEDYAKALFNRWGVGDKARDDGVMILVSTQDREMRVQLGEGFGTEWDGVAQGVIDSAFLPLLREGRTVDAIETGTAAVIDSIARPFSSGKAPVPVSRPVSRDQGSWLGTLMIPVILILAVLISAWRWVGDIITRFLRCPECGQKGGLRRERFVTSPATTLNDGWGNQITTCDHCGYRREETYTIRQKRERGRSGGGGGSFGGGRSSGGGASGRW